MGKGSGRKSDSVAGGIFIAVVALVFVAAGIANFISGADFLFKGADDINTMIGDNGLKVGEFTRLRIDANFGAYAETKHTINGFIPAGNEQHYMVWLDDGSLISVTVKGSDKYDRMDAIEEQTYAYIDSGDYLSKSVTYTGKITSISGDLKRYYQEALDYLGADSTNATIYYLDIDTTETKGSIIGMTVACLVFGVVLFIAGVVTIKNAIRKKAAMEVSGTQVYPPDTQKTPDIYESADDTPASDIAYSIPYIKNVNDDEADEKDKAADNGDALSENDDYIDNPGGYSSGFDSSFYNSSNDSSI